MKLKSIRKNLAEIYKDLQDIKIEPTDSFQSSLDKFYSVMRKWGVKQGTWTKGGGRLCDNPEWSMLWAVYRENKILSLDVWMALSEPPKDLLAYGKPPKLAKISKKRK